MGGWRELYPYGLLLTEGFNDLVNHFGDGAYKSQKLDASDFVFSAPWSSFSNDVEALDHEGGKASFARKVLINLTADGGRGASPDILILCATSTPCKT